MGAAPRDGERMFCSSPQGMADIIGDAKSLFHDASALSKNYTDGTISVPTLGFNFASSPNVYTHTCGTYDANYDVAAVPASGATTLDVDTGTGTILVGDILPLIVFMKLIPLPKHQLEG